MTGFAMPGNLNGRLQRLEVRVQGRVAGDDLTPTAEERAEEADFRQRCQAYEDQWRYVKARHARSHWRKVMGVIPAHWPYNIVLPDARRDWEQIQPADEEGCRFWEEAGRRLYTLIDVATALEVSPADLPLWEETDAWEALWQDIVEAWERLAAAGDAAAQQALRVQRGEEIAPEVLAGRERYRVELSQRYQVPLGQIPDGQQTAFYEALWRYPQSQRELRRRIWQWRQQQPGA